MDETSSIDMTSKGKGAESHSGAGHGEVLSREAFACRFQESMPVMWCIAAAVLGRRGGAEDVLQEAAMIALSKLNEFRASTSFNAWLGQIIRFVALNHRRKEIRHQHSADPASLQGVTTSGGKDRDELTMNGSLRIDQTSFDDDVLTALNSLDEVARACLLLRTVMDLPYRQIALALDIPEGTAMSHVHRSRTHLREMLLRTGKIEEEREQGGKREVS